MDHYNLPHDHGQNIGYVLDQKPEVEKFQEVAETFRVLGDTTRLRIFWLLCHCEECVSNIAAAMEMSDPAISHHLRILKKSELVVSRRDGKEVYYQIADNLRAKQLHQAVDNLFEIVCPKVTGGSVE